MSGRSSAQRPESAGAAELPYVSDRTRVVRLARVDGRGSVVHKTPLSSNSRRLRHERAILERLRGVDGVVQLADETPPPGALALRDTGMPSLASAVSAGPLAVNDLLAIGANLARVLAGIHRAGVTHRDINPTNVLWSSAPPRVLFIDFDLATTAAEDRPGFTHEREITGTLAYLAPEQTGRTGHPVDQRADLYGLGATLYELATGAPPFGFGDPLQLVHDHLAALPVPPAVRNPAVPTPLSDIILRLLEKEPDRRYQTAEGLAYDLNRLWEDWRAGRDRPLTLGERDFPLRLSAPSRLVGRETEIEVLAQALRHAVAEGNQGLLVSGAPGVGKTALLDQLRPMVTGRGGWFVAGKFDQYRQDDDADGVRQALRQLGRLLLAAPEEEIAELRRRLLESLGTNSGLVAAVLPEYASLLAIPGSLPEGDPATMRDRMNQAGLDLLRTVAAPGRPLVLAIDDVQWATQTALGLLDAVLLDEGLRGVLLVAAYRHGEVDAAHPLTGLLTRWQRLGVPPRQLRLENLPHPALATMLAETLAIDEGAAAPLADVVGSRTGGNPYDTVELVNALRRDGALVAGADGWQWDIDTLRRYLGHGDVVDLIATRMAALPQPTQRLLEAAACLGGEVTVTLLCDATGLSVDAAEDQLRPALEDGLLVSGQDGVAVRFQHDRVQQAAFSRLSPTARMRLRLALARRLSAVAYRGVYAAEQYLPVVARVSDPAEQRRVIELFRIAAARARATADHGRVERFVSAATALVAPAGPVTVDAATSVELAIERHAALYSLGRLDELDAAYLWITELTDDPLARVRAAELQIISLTNQTRLGEAIALGRDLLAQLGQPIPEDPARLAAETDAGMEVMYRWVAAGDENDDLRRPRCDRPRVLAMAHIIDRTIPAAYFAGDPCWPWLVMTAVRWWAEQGPARALAGPFGYAMFATVAVRADYRTGYAALRRVLAFGAASGFEPDTAHIRATYALSAVPWFEPLEEAIAQARQAHELLVQAGELQFACHSYYSTLPTLMDCAATLDDLAAEVDAALAFTARTGNEHAAATYQVYRHVIGAMCAAENPACAPADGVFDEAAHLAAVAGNQTALAYVHVTHAVAAAIFGQQDGLVWHATAVRPLMPYITATYITVSAHLIQALALAHRLRAAGPSQRAELLTEFGVEHDWLAARAADDPATFRHLPRWLTAELAWASGDASTAMSAFDEALRDVVTLTRPWQHALIAERAALFHQEQLLGHTATMLLWEARSGYERWGATAKVADLDRRYPELRKLWGGTGRGRGARQGNGRRSSSYSVEEIDLLAVIKASQTLSSETSLDRLRGRVASILSAMTGATAVRLVLWDDSGTWLVPRDDGGPLPIDVAAAQGLVPLSALRYVERTHEPLVVDDAVTDERFARDPYFAGLDCCSLVVVPIMAQGRARALLLLENRLSRTAFAASRLAAVELIAGQLAVSLDNALLYASLERKVAERTEALGRANQRLEALSATDALTGLANRRRLTEALEEEWRMARVRGRALALAMIDIDFFKLYNDHYGHPAGDRCLRGVAAALREKLRDTDTIARYGGEEFVIVMPGVDIVIAEQIANRVKDAVAALNQPHEHSPMGVVTVSIGVTAALPAEGGGPEQLIEMADRLLYRAKRNGRNRIEAGPNRNQPDHAAPIHLPRAEP